MIEFIISPDGFIILLLLFLLGALGAALLKNNDESANYWSSFFAIAGSLWGVLFGLGSLFAVRPLLFTIGASPFSLLQFSFLIDKLAAFFVFIICLIALFCSLYGIDYVRQYYRKYSIGSLGFFYNLFIAGMLLVVTATNGLFFLLAWEIMSVASFFLVIYDRHEQENIRAGFLYLVMTHVGTSFIIAAFLLLYKFTGSFEFSLIRNGAGMIPGSVKNAVFVLSLIGFGTKAGIIPLHIWLPGAHPAAPSHVSGLMSGVMIKTGIYMMIRIFLDLLQPFPLWWGVVLLITGAVSSLLGVLYALTEHDIKKLLAYHSIENIGIILLGLGSALTFLSLQMPALALVGLVASLFHTLNHATFKSLLFLGAGSVINQTHTRNMEEYGGLIKLMPQTALLFLVGSMAITALPPFNGFFSEWLTFQALFQGIAAPNSQVIWIFVIAAGALAFTGGLALACFVKAFGAIFLARPRSDEAKHAKESSPFMLAGMWSLGALSLLFGVGSGYVSQVLQAVGGEFAVFQNLPAPFLHTEGGWITVGGFSSVFAPAIFLALLLALLAVVFAVNRLLSRRQTVRTGPTWDCGTDLTPRMEITSTGFARSIILIFKGILKPTMQKAVEYRDGESRYLPKSRMIKLGMNDIYEKYLYEPAQAFVLKFSLYAKKVQSGLINMYILYILIALVGVLLFSL
ncbi:MAG: hypothetical protein K0B01_04900 [Syntrophobacterales bacterium]|nr:hypothetical protein [Syntrophobacterales bacterium]